jgi:hypothetical protein
MSKFKPSPMKSKTVIALRANLVLFSFSTSIASVVVLTVASLFDFWGGSNEVLPYQAATLLVSALIAVSLQRRARLAFDQALHAGLVKVNHLAESRAIILPECSLAWLVQLHVELQGVSNLSSAARP